MAIVNAQIKITDTNVLDPFGANPAPYEGAVPQNKTYAITNILICNPSTADTIAFDMHLVPFNDPIDTNTTAVVKSLSLPPGETFTFDSERVILEQGDRIVLIADTEGSFGNISVSNIVPGKTYQIVTPGDTDFVAINSPNNTAGTSFIASAAGTGTGTVTLEGYSALAATVSYMEV